MKGPPAMAKKGLVKAPRLYPSRIRGFRRPILSEMYPEKILEMAAVDSAIPSISPTKATLAPRVPVRNRGSSEWIISDEMSMNRLTRPSAHTVGGMLDLASPEEAKGGFIARR
jgi:hypothetical protein